MKIEIEIAADRDDIDGILSLQKENIKSSDDTDRDWSDGFVTLRHNPEILQQMMEQSPQIVALHQGQVVGYSLTMLPETAGIFPILDPMIRAFGEINLSGKQLTEIPFIIGGQCCIDQRFRGRNLLDLLYRRAKEELKDHYDYCVTEIDRNNPRSLQAHLKIGFEKIHTYTTRTRIWDVVAQKWG